jgi:hypothetical protein
MDDCSVIGAPLISILVWCPTSAMVCVDPVVVTFGLGVSAKAGPAAATKPIPNATVVQIRELLDVAMDFSSDRR